MVRLHSSVKSSQTNEMSVGHDRCSSSYDGDPKHTTHDTSLRVSAAFRAGGRHHEMIVALSLGMSGMTQR